MRKIIKLMDHWTFTGFDHHPIQIDLPHTCNNIDGQDGGNDFKRGTCIYEKELAKPEFNEHQVVY